MNTSKLSSAELDRHAARLTEEGYTIIPEVLSRADLDKARRAIDETLEAEAATARRYGLQNENLLMCYNAQGKHPHFPGMLTRYPEPLLVARRVLGEDMFAHNLAIRKPLPTGKKDWTKLGGYLHADWHHFTVNPFIGGRHYPLAVQSVWCISEFTRQNGATYVWPRSHLSLDSASGTAADPAGGVDSSRGPGRFRHPLGLGPLAHQRRQLRDGAPLLAGVLLPALVGPGLQRRLPAVPPGGQGAHDGGGAANLGVGGRGPAQYPFPGNDAGANRSPHARGEGRPQHRGFLTAVVIDSMTGTGMLSETWVGSRYTAHLSERNCLLR